MFYTISCFWEAWLEHTQWRYIMYVVNYIILYNIHVYCISRFITTTYFLTKIKMSYLRFFLDLFRNTLIYILNWGSSWLCGKASDSQPKESNLGLCRLFALRQGTFIHEIARGELKRAYKVCNNSAQE